MSEATRNPMTLKPVVLELPGMHEVTVRTDIDAGGPTLDVYAPPGDGRPRPAVVFVSGYPDPGFEMMLGCKLKDMASYVSWARLVAASGMVAVTYANRTPADVALVMRHLHAHGATLGIDPDRIGVWASSGNVPNALSLLLRDAEVRVACAVLAYGHTLDLDGATHVADAAKQYYFATPAAGKSVDDLRADVPLFLARAGRDETPGLNATLDRFAAAALARNLPITLTNHPTAPHAFDIVEDSEISRESIRQMLGFLRFHLAG
ncbi:alpha/beta hydrolase [Polyangium sp. 6x1]|uniref:alpha/beta hydrolase n=1 Tax=Polyangium sp. 6x1 TaxID=3042689 RepID=UPI002482A89E|nr:alpha/beta hydrolase [Polyangium sp. 6x1]MDI1449056.1 alpha/beta hydrolase [Polyangium sp. 6x1]